MGNLNKVNYTDYETVITAANLNGIQDSIISNTSYVTCSTAAGTAAKVATLENFTLSVGAAVKVKFTNTNTATNPTLNVNSTGAKPIYTNTGSNVGTTPDTSWSAGEIVELVYDGTNWVRPAGTLGSVGALADLETTNKTTIVAAINEVNTNTDATNTAIGDLADLETTATSDLVSAINEVNAETDVIDKLNAVVVTTPTITSLPVTFTASQLTFVKGSAITTDLMCGKYDYEATNEDVITDEIAVSTDTAGQITITGTLSGSTALTIYFRHFDVSPPASGVTASYVGMHDIYKLELTNITSLPVTITGLAGITAQHEAVVEGWGLITPRSSAGSTWEYTCGDGSITITGTFSGSTATTVNVSVGIPDNKITVSAT